MVRLCRAAILVCGCLTTAPAREAAAQPARGDEPLSACADLIPGPTRTVARVIDGETVALDDGSELRLIGALAPRATDSGAQPGTWPLEVEAAAELGALVLGKSVELAFGGERSDRHGRLQAHAFVAGGGERRWVQGHLLEQGLARAYAQAGNRACGLQLLDAEGVARLARRGLWADAAYRIRPSDPPGELIGYRNTFQIVEGRIVRVAQTRGTVYLNFGPSRLAFAVSLRRADRALLGADSGDVRALEGAHVRVRGWIEVRGYGPMIDLSTAGLFEPIAGPDADTAGGRRLRSRRSGAGTLAPPAPEAKPPGLVETGR
jgi:endonuclease YncB( thermonuclease family)